MNRLLTGLACGLAALACAPVFAAGLPAIADANTDQSAPNTNFGSNGVLGLSTARVALIRFNATQVAQGAGSSATLSVKVILPKNSNNGVAVRLVTSNWNEGTVTANTLPTIATSALDQKTITLADQGKLVTFNVSAALAAWKSNPSTNFGIALVATAPSPNLQLGSREGGNPATLTIASPVADNDATVAPSGADYTNPVTAASNALEGDKWCVAPTTTKPCTIHVASGVYPLATTLALPAGVNLIGEEKGETLLVSAASVDSAVNAGDSLISDLTIVSAHRVVTYTPTFTTGLRLERVALSGRGFGALSPSNTTGSVSVTDSEITSRSSTNEPAVTLDLEGGAGTVKIVRSRLVAISTAGGAQAFSLTAGGSTGTNLQVEDSSIYVSGVTSATGVSMLDENSRSFTFTRVQIDVSSPARALGISGGGPFLSKPIQIVDTQINVQGGQNSGGFVWFSTSPIVLDGVSITTNGTAASFSDSNTTQPPTPSISLLRSVLHGGAVGLQLTGRGIEVSSSYISGDAAVTSEIGTLHATSSALAGQVQLTNSVTTCNRVLDANLAVRPPNCVAP